MVHGLGISRGGPPSPPPPREDLGLNAVDMWEIELDAIKDLEGFSPPIGEWGQKLNLVGMRGG